MVLSPSRVADLTNGYEQRSDGLWLHHGKADIGSARIINQMWSNTGAGMELLFNPVARAATILVYDRDANAYLDLNIAAKNLTLSTLGGALNVPAGSIGTAAIAPNAVQQTLGVYTAGTTFNTATTNVWVQTPIGVSFTTSGGMLRCEFSTVLYHSVAAGQWLMGFGWDGVVQLPLATQHGPSFANGMVYYSGVYYMTLAPGAHSAQLFVDNASVGTLNINASIYSTFFVTEQKR